MMTTETIQIDGHTFTLHPSGAMYWNEKKMLLVADVHLGKIAHFRKHGSAVPRLAILHNFEQLNEILAYFRPKTLCFLGDLFHSHKNTEWELFVAWKQHVIPKIVLITGNHDIISPVAYEKNDIELREAWRIEHIWLTHIPQLQKGITNIAGHIHPGVQLKGLGKQTLSLPCFIKKHDQIILPAFGTFTGKHIISPKKEDEVFAITENEVIRVN